jgi:DNA-binding response OmpR family regulator
LGIGGCKVGTTRTKGEAAGNEMSVVQPQFLVVILSRLHVRVRPAAANRSRHRRAT